MPTVYNKVTAGGQTLIDLSQDTVTDASHIVSGHTGHLADGTQVAGTGGGSVEVEEKQVNFIDYDGTILHSYTKAEANALTALPSNPSHTGLTAQGWNWTLQEIRDQLTAVPDGPIWVGQMYVTASGNTEIDITLNGPRLSPYLGIAPNGTVDIDWGDGTTHSTVTGTSYTTQKRTQHTYETAGSYTIILTVTSGSFAFYGSDEPYSLLNINSSTNYQNRVYSNAVTAVRIGNNAKIRQYGLSNLYSVEYITIPSTAEPSGNYILGMRSTIKTIILPSGMTNLGTRACGGNYRIIHLSIPKSITTISERAFDSLYALTSITIPAGVTSVGTYAFSNCRALEAVYFSSTACTFGTYAFNMCNCMRIARLPSGTTTLPNYCFTSNTRLSDNVLPSSLTTINQYTFNENFSMQKLTIPSGVSTIGANAFTACHGMKEYHFLRTTPATIQSTTFTNIPSDCIIYVPYSSDHSVLNTYKSASNWSNQSSKIQEEPQ